MLCLASWNATSSLLYGYAVVTLLSSVDFAVGEWRWPGLNRCCQAGVCILRFVCCCPVMLSSRVLYYKVLSLLSCEDTTRLSIWSIRVAVVTVLSWMSEFVLLSLLSCQDVRLGVHLEYSCCCRCCSVQLSWIGCPLGVIVVWQAVLCRTEISCCVLYNKR